jgi:hypothetical protein
MASKNQGSADGVIFRQTAADQFETGVTHMNLSLNQRSSSRQIRLVIMPQTQDGTSQDFGREP